MLKMALHHVDVMSTSAAGVSLDKPSVEGWHVIAQVGLQKQS